MLSAAPASPQKMWRHAWIHLREMLGKQAGVCTISVLFAAARFVWSTLIIASVVLNALCFTAGVWELKQRKTAALSAQAASFRRHSCSQARAFQNVGMTTETFANRLKNRKAEAFRRRVIKMKEGRGKRTEEGMCKPKTPL